MLLARKDTSHVPIEELCLVSKASLAGYENAVRNRLLKSTGRELFIMSLLAMHELGTKYYEVFVSFYVEEGVVMACQGFGRYGKAVAKGDIDFGFVKMDRFTRGSMSHQPLTTFSDMMKKVQDKMKRGYFFADPRRFYSDCLMRFDFTSDLVSGDRALVVKHLQLLKGKDSPSVVRLLDMSSGDDFPEMFKALADSVGMNKERESFWEIRDELAPDDFQAVLSTTLSIASWLGSGEDYYDQIAFQFKGDNFPVSGHDLQNKTMPELMKMRRPSSLSVTRMLERDNIYVGMF